MGAFVGVPIGGIRKESVGWSIGFSVLLIIVGLIALAAPLLAGVAVTALVGWLIILGGVGHLALAWHVRGAGAHLWEALIGIAYLAAGAFILFHPLAGLVGLAFFLGVYLFVKGIIELVAGFAMRRVSRSSGGLWLFVDAVISIVLAILIWAHLPSSAAWAVGILLGVAILFSGLSRLAVALSARRMHAAVL